jgi:hypothetical protein
VGLWTRFSGGRCDGNGGFGRGTSAFEEREEVATVAFGQGLLEWFDGGRAGGLGSGREIEETTSGVWG